MLELITGRRNSPIVTVIKIEKLTEGGDSCEGPSAPENDELAAGVCERGSQALCICEEWLLLVDGFCARHVGHYAVFHLALGAVDGADVDVRVPS